MESKRIYANYKAPNKWLGIIDYKSLLVLIIYALILILIIKNLNLKFVSSFYIFIILLSPSLAILCVSNKNVSSVDMLYVIIRYFIKNKIYLDVKFISNNKRYKYMTKKLD